MKATQIIAALALVLLMTFPALALDATQTARQDITPKSPVPTGSVATWPMDAAVPPGWLACNGQAVPVSYPELSSPLKKSLFPCVASHQLIDAAKNI